MTVDPNQPPGRPQLVLYEERPQVTTTREPVERVLLRRVVTTETRQVNVEVRREELVIERLPITDHAPANTKPVARAPLVILLSEEVPVVSLLTRPYEQVTVHVETIADQAQVSVTLAREQGEAVTTAAMPN